MTSTYRPGERSPTAADVAASLTACGFAVGGAQRMTTFVLDTFDGRVAAAGLRLTLGDDRRLTLGGAGVPATIQVTDAPRTAEDLPPGPLRRRLDKILGGRVLIRLVDVTSTRTVATKHSSSGKLTTSVTLHERAAAGGLPLADGLLVEVHEMTGYARQAAATADLLAGAGMCPTAADMVELAAHAAGVSLTGFSVPVGVPLDRQLPAIDGYRAVLGNLRDAAVANWDGTVADIDTEFLHDLRVAVRRTRSVLANARRVVPDDIRQWARDGFAWLGDVTGPARDLDVYQLEWPRYIGALDAEAAQALEPLREHFGAQRRDAHDRLNEQLTGSRANQIIDDWSAWLDAPVDRSNLPDRASLPIEAVVARRIRRAHRRLVDRGRTITSSTPAASVHQLRIDAKKLRYLIECFGGLYAPAARKSFVVRLKQLQDLLGEHQDTDIHAAQLRQFVADPFPGATTGTLIAIGQLIGQFEQRRQACRAEVEPRFAAFDTDKSRRALDKMLANSG